MICLYILEINPLSVVSFANIFSHSEGCLFISFTVSFAVHKVFLKRQKYLNKWKDIPCSWLGRFNIVKTSVLPKLIYRFNTIPVKILESYFVDIDKLILKLIRKDKRPRIANTTSKQENKVGGLTLLEFKIYYKPTVIKTV